MRVLVAVAAGVALTIADPAGAGGPAKPAPPPPSADLRGAKIDDLPLSVVIPLAKGRTVTSSFPEHWWVKGAGRGALDPEGLVVQNFGDLAHYGLGGSVYVGALALPATDAGEKAVDVRRRVALDLVTALDARLDALGVKLVTPVAKILLTEGTTKVDGKKQPVLRSTVFASRLAESSTDDPKFTYSNQAIFVPSPEGDRLVYLVVQTSHSTEVFDAVLGGLSFAAAPTGKGRALKLVDSTSGRGDAIESRFACLEVPAGFEADLAERNRERGLWYASRTDASGRVTATLRIARRDSGVVGTGTLEEEARAEFERSHVEGASEPKTVPLRTNGARALVVDHPSTLGAEACAARTAAFLVDDQLWTVAWRTLGDEALVTADRAAFDRLLAGWQVVVRAR